MNGSELTSEMVRPHDLREGDQIVVAREVLKIEVAPLPSTDRGSHQMVAVTDHGRLSWSMTASQWPCVERVARADRQVA